MIALEDKLQMIKKNIRKKALPRINAHLRSAASPLHQKTVSVIRSEEHTSEQQ